MSLTNKSKFLRRKDMGKTDKYLTVGKLLEKLKDVPKDYMLITVVDGQWAYGESTDVDDELKEVTICGHW